MKVCRFKTPSNTVHIGLLTEDDSAVRDLAPAGVSRLETLLEAEDPARVLEKCAQADLPRQPLAGIQLCAPVELQEVWAAGVTYLRSKTARMEESDFSANAYDRVYSAARPEIFFKSLPEKVVPAGEPVGIRRDAKWNVPEPELALVMNSRGRIVGYTIGNDMSSRDIEGANLLYLPQAKIYSRSCALGPWITLGATEQTAREWTIRIQVQRHGQPVFAGESSIGQIKRGFDELAEYLFRCQDLPHGAVLLTGTGVVPPDSFTLQAQDEIEIEISGIGSLQNRVVTV